MWIACNYSAMPVVFLWLLQWDLVSDRLFGKNYFLDPRQICKIWNTLMDNQLDDSWYCTSGEFGLGFLYLLQNNVLWQTNLAQPVLKCPNLPARRLVQVAAVEKHLWIHTFSFLEEDWILYCLFLPFLGECLEFLPLDESTGCAEIIYPWTKFCVTPPMLKNIDYDW